METVKQFHTERLKQALEEIGSFASSGKKNTKRCLALKLDRRFY
jgi:predicted enzyme involved in methoxymalonyl-ACP biosynthesis